MGGRDKRVAGVRRGSKPNPRGTLFRGRQTSPLMTATVATRRLIHRYTGARRGAVAAGHCFPCALRDSAAAKKSLHPTRSRNVSNTPPPARAASSSSIAARTPRQCARPTTPTTVSTPLTACDRLTDHAR